MLTFNIEGFHRNNFYLSRVLSNVPKLIFLQETWVSYSQEYSMSKMFKDYSLSILSASVILQTLSKLT